MKNIMRKGYPTSLTDVAQIIGANILNIANQDYDPQGPVLLC